MLQYDATRIERLRTLGSRGVVGSVLGELSQANPRIVAAYADVGSRFGLIEEMGERGYQTGIAEQSLIGVISGLCHEGFIAYGVAYAPFLAMRAADQIRMSVGEMGLGIKLVGGSAGLVSGNLGSASLALDDVAVMQAIPNMTVLCPADGLEEAKILEAVSATETPAYIRLTGGGELPVVYSKDFEYRIGRANVVACEGADVVIYAAGVLVYSAIRAAQLLAGGGIGCTVVDMHTIKPLDEETLRRFDQIPLVVSLEEHNVIGGLGSAIAGFLSREGRQRLLRIGVEDFYPAPDRYETLLWRCGLTPEQVAEQILRELR